MNILYPAEGLAYYNADLKYATRLSQEEQEAIFQAAIQTETCLDKETRNLLVEDHLVIYTKVKLAPISVQGFRYTLEEPAQLPGAARESDQSAARRSPTSASWLPVVV